jgi:hypothetical protein
VSGSNEGARPLADKTAIGLSLLCAVHCLALPILIVLAPALGSLAIADESFHLWMVTVVVPVSAYALYMGCREHRKMLVLGIGAAGILLLIAAVILGHDVLGEAGERGLTLAGAALVAWSHLQNYRLCRSAA